MTNDEVVIQLRIDVAVLKKDLEHSERALRLAHGNIFSYVGFAIMITAIVVTISLKIFKGGL